MDGDLTEILRQVMENPQFGQMVQTMKAQMGTDGSGGIDPGKVMEKMPELMAALGPMMGLAGQTAAGTGSSANGGEEASDGGGQGEAETGGATEAGADAVQIHDIQSARSGIGSMFFRPGSRDKRNKLLAALKPYLSPARCAMVDRAISAMQMGELLGTVAPTHHDT